MKLPVPDPSVVFESPIVGFAVVDQQEPLSVIALPPSAIIFPPVTAAVKVTELDEVVVNAGIKIGLDVNETSFPYAVPALFVAYALTWYNVPGSNPVRLLIKLPVPVPSVVLEQPIVGFTVVAQHTPLTVTAPPPSVVMVPPEIADDKVIKVVEVVDREANSLNLMQEDNSVKTINTM
jgi:hypothetical protein